MPISNKYKVWGTQGQGEGIEPDGEIKIPVFNFSSQTFIVKPRMRIAQIVFAPVARVDMIEVEELSKTERGTGGFGSTSY